MNKASLLGMERAAFHRICEAFTTDGGKKFPAYQLETAYRQAHRLGGDTFDSIAGLPLQLRSLLNDHFSIDAGSIQQAKASLDGTQKWTIQFGEDATSTVETVLIPEHGGRNTLCISSQMGCSLNCKFCSTGTQRLKRNLTAGEILGQFIRAAVRVGDIPMLKKQGPSAITNLVFMGQGEPLYNWSNVSRAIQTLTDPELYGMAGRRITLSTAGIAPLIPKVGQLGIQLAISLHAPTDSLRNEIMAINHTYPLAVLLESCRGFLKETRGRDRITFEYVMLRNFNDSVRCAQDLARLLDGMNAFVNLIPLNEWPGCPYKGTFSKQIHEFSDMLTQCKVPHSIRKNRGNDIGAACGQLRSQLLANKGADI